MYTVGSVARFIINYHHMIGGEAPQILARAFNRAQGGGAIMSGDIVEVVGGNANTVALFQGVMEDYREMKLGLAELSGQMSLDILVVLAIFFEGNLPSTLVTIIQAEVIDSKQFNLTLRAELKGRGIELEDHVQFSIAKKPSSSPPQNDDSTSTGDK